MRNFKFIRLLGLSILIVLSFMTMIAPAAAQQTITVNTTADENGTNTAACSIREAIQAAYQNSTYDGCTRPSGGGSGTADIVSIPAGTYVITSTLTYFSSDGGTQGDMALQGAGRSATIIQGNDTFRLIDFSGSAGEHLDINDLTLRDGGGSNGGCVNALNGQLDITRVTITSCTVTGNGGGMEAEGTTVNFESVNFTYNYAGGNGGALFTATSGTKLFFDVGGPDTPYEYHLDHNEAGGSGGGVYLGEGDLQMYYDWHFENNVAGLYGGAIYAGGSTHLEISGATQVNGDGPGANLMGIIFANVAATGSALYWNSQNSSSSMTDVCFGGNTEYSVFSTVGNKVSAPDNWWSSPTGPLVEGARNTFITLGNHGTGEIYECANDTYATTGCTASAFSNGDSITGDGTQNACNNCTAGAVAIGMAPSFPAAWGDGFDNNPPANADFLGVIPGDSGCVTCSPASAIDPTAIACFPPPNGN